MAATPTPNATGNLLPAAVFFALFSLASLGAVGLFSTRQRSGRAGVLVRIIAAITNAAALSALLYYFIPALRMDRSLLLTTAVISMVTSFLVRLLFERIVEEDFFRRRVLVYGAGKRARSLLELRRRSDTRGFRIIGFMATEGDDVIVPPERVIARPADLLSMGDRSAIRRDRGGDGRPPPQLPDGRAARMPARRRRDHRAGELPRARDRQGSLDILNPSWMIFGDGFRRVATADILERVFDILASFGMLAARRCRSCCSRRSAIKLEDGCARRSSIGSARVGQYGKPFRC